MKMRCLCWKLRRKIYKQIREIFLSIAETGKTPPGWRKLVKHITYLKVNHTLLVKHDDDQIAVLKRFGMDKHVTIDTWLQDKDKAHDIVNRMLEE